MKKILCYLAAGAVLLTAACSKSESDVNPEDKPGDPTEKPEDPEDPENPDGPKSSRTATTVLNLTPEFFALSGIEQGSQYEAGKELTLTLTAGEVLSGGFSDYHAEHIHVHVGDKVYQPAAAAGQSLQVNVTVPDADFEVVACYSVQQHPVENGFTMTLEANPDVRLYGVSPELRYDYFDCYLLVTDAYTIDRVEFNMGAGWQDLAGTVGCFFSRTDVPNVYKVTVRPDYQNVTADVELRVSGTPHARYRISWVNADEAHVDLSQFTFPTESIDGEQVYAEVWTREPYYLDGVKASVSVPSLETYARAYIRFTMPASDVAITLNFKEKIPVSVSTGDSHITAAALYDAPDIYYGVPTEKGIPGEQVFVFANAEGGFIPALATAGGSSFPFTLYGDGIDRYAYYSAVEIPSGATSLSVSVTSVAVHYVSGEGVYVEGGSAHPAGETVNFTVSVPTGKKVSEVSVTSGGTALPFSFDSPYGRFTMPDADVTISVSYENTDQGDTVHVSASFDEDEYIVRSSTNYDWDFAEGFDVAAGTNIYLTVYSNYGDKFWVGIQVGSTASYYEATEDDMSGEFEFGRSFTASADVLIKVGPTRSSVGF